MRFFVTGASGFIGSAVVAELRSAGHEVLGLARSDAAAATVAGLGAEVVRGTIEEVDLLRDAAGRSDGVINLAFNHDFSQFADSARVEAAAIDAMGDALAGTGRPLTVASGTLGLAPGRPALETDTMTADSTPRGAGWSAALALADRGVRATAVRLAPSVHNERKGGFASVLVDCARRTGVSGYLGDGTQRWPAVHVSDAARLFRMAAEKGEAGTAYHAVGDPGLALRDIAETIGVRFGLPARPVPDEDAQAQFGFLAAAVGLDAPASSAWTQETLGWRPTGPGLLTDLADFQR
ncbi:SDR family oxidoreductase [Tsukamurella soli]|uniref:SDR family oxidoreductase n=1 Tax=Tsukamurella soli TaxID=644556 RepID=UPI00360A227D